jgi:hypothetical protein
MTTPEVATPEVAPAPAAPAAAPPAAAEAPPSSVRVRQTEEQVLAAFDAEYEKGLDVPAGKPDVDDEPEVAAPAKETKEAEEPEPEAAADETDGEWEEGVVPPKPEEALPNKERSALKAIKDPEVRRQFARAHFLVKAYEKSGMRLGAVHRYIAAAPTPEILEERVRRAEQLDAFVDEFSSGAQDRGASARVAEVLRQTNPEAFGSFVGLLTDNLHVVLPPAKMREVGDRFFRAAIANMREKADENGDLVLADVADGVEQFLGLGKPAKGQREKTQDDPVAAQRLREAEEVIRREKEREAEAGRQRYAEFNNIVVQDAVQDAASFAKDWIEENCGAYPNPVKKELFDKLYGSVRGHIEGNTVIARTLQRLVDEGAGDEAHRAKCAGYLAKTIKSVFVTVAPGVLTDIQRLVGPATQRRAERAERARSIRDVGGAGAPAIAGTPRLTGKGKHADDVLKEFDALG